MEVHARCSACGLVFKREVGYFLGALYIEYGLAAVVLTLITVGLRAWRSFLLWQAVLLALAIFLPFVPLTIRFSRTLWIYWDNLIDPQSL
jgi:hypothetical protein